jgi:hypothetical protein
MIKIFLLTNSEEVIGFIEEPIEIATCEYYNIVNPMYIRDDYMKGGSMRLRDAMMLSSETLMTIPRKHVVSFYTPSAAMERYYHAAVKYATEITKKEIDSQIRHAVSHLEDALEEERQSGLSELLKRLSPESSKKVH